MLMVVHVWPNSHSSVCMRPDGSDPGLMVLCCEEGIIFTFDYRQEHARFEFMDFLEALSSEAKNLIAELEDGSCIPLPFRPSAYRPLPDQPVADR